MSLKVIKGEDGLIVRINRKPHKPNQHPQRGNHIRRTALFTQRDYANIMHFAEKEGISVNKFIVKAVQQAIIQHILAEQP